MDPITVTFSEGDVRSLAAERNIPAEVAIERADEWQKAIEERLIEQGNELLYNVITTGQP